MNLRNIFSILMFISFMLVVVACGIGNIEERRSAASAPTYTPAPVQTTKPLSTDTPLPTSTPQIIIKEIVATATLTPLPTDTSTSNPSSTLPAPATTSSPTQTTVPTIQPFVEWSNETGEWTASSTPPECGLLEEIFFVAPIDVSIVNEFARPGRAGGNGFYYLAHGYLRANNTPHDQIEVKFPAEGFSLYAANRRVEDYYIEEKETNTRRHIVDDEEQVKLEFHHPCGIAVMIDHLAQVTDQWAEIIKDVPVLTNDSRVTFMSSGKYFVESGEVLAHAIGHATNTYLDLGVYDLRSKNDSAEMLARDWPKYASTASHGICWTGLFGPEAQELLEGLTAGSVRTSDFCD